jgi:acyl-coenzyme A synthetase/AMP-(fatty) acid ligase
MQHAYGIEHGVMAPMRAGATVAFKAGFDLMAGAEALLDGTTVFPAVPVTLEAATRVARTDHTLRLAYTAGSPLPESVRTAFEAAWNVPVGDLYGMTEVGTITWGFGDDRRAVPGVSIGVVDPESDDASATIRSTGAGEIVVRSDAMSTGYLAEAGVRPDPGRRIDGHLRTGDLGEIDENGRLRITGRAKLQFDVGGLKVNPEEVEAVLLTIEQIREVAVVPVALSETVTRVMAVVVLDPDMNIGPAGLDIAIRVRSRERLAPHQRPRIVQVVEELPRSATGKLLRGRLIDAFTAPGE